MAGSFTETTTIGLGSRLLSSIKGLVIGFLLFILSFVLLYWNEGRQGLAPLANTATEIASTIISTDASLQGKLVSTTGQLTSTEQIGDSLYLNPGNYIAVSRKVEMYAWVEEQSTSSQTNTGGSETNTTTYTYKKEWVRSPEDSSAFKQSAEHSNPAKSIQDYEAKVSTAKVGVYTIDPNTVGLPGYSALSLTADKLNALAKPFLMDGYLYLPYKSPIVIIDGTTQTINNPSVGDLRISYDVLLPNQEVTVFAKLDGSSLKTFTSESGQSLYRMFIGDRAASLAAIANEDALTLWILRIVGFLMMWIGLSSLFAPFTTLADIIPILGSLGRSAVGCVTLAICLVLSAITIVISRILHNPLGIIIVVLLVIVGLVLLVKSRKPAVKK